MLLRNGSFDSGTLPWRAVKNPLKDDDEVSLVALGGPSRPKAGGKYLRLRSLTGGGSVVQEVSREVVPANQSSFGLSAWLRAGGPGESSGVVKGEMRLWVQAQKPYRATTPFVVTETWEQVLVLVDVAGETGDLKVEIVVESADEALEIDGIVLV
jgi:hypothetical protein